MSDTQSSGRVNKKSPLVAVLLAVVYPGLGHVYLRRWGRALMWFALIVATLLALVPETAIPTEASLDAILEARAAIPQDVGLLSLGLSALSVVDAYWIASKSSEEGESDESSGETQSCPSCGKELDADLDFCHWCTTRLGESEE